jgi:hypothetical protein
VVIREAEDVRPRRVPEQAQDDYEGRHRPPLPELQEAAQAEGRRTAAQVREAKDVQP